MYLSIGTLKSDEDQKQKLHLHRRIGNHKIVEEIWS
jgi:hypothetical protein